MRAHHSSEPASSSAAGSVVADLRAVLSSLFLVRSEADVAPPQDADASNASEKESRRQLTPEEEAAIAKAKRKAAVRVRVCMFLSRSCVVFVLCSRGR